MQKNVVIKLFKAIEGDLQNPNSSSAVHGNINKSIQLAVDFFGISNDHYSTLLKATNYPYDMAREIAVAEIKAIIAELEEKSTQKPIIEGSIRSPIDVLLSDKTKNLGSTRPVKENNINKVFIVHGHDREMKNEVANVLLKLKLKPIILHEQPDEGRTIIEKFEMHSDVDFAVILLSPDDFAFSSGASPKEGKYRARQNVIMELGYFIAKLGRNRVVTLYRQNNNFEIPSEYLGVLYKPYIGDWRYKLADEMKKIDPRIDKNLL
jgi:predicted nucleotide-binding protein